MQKITDEISQDTATDNDEFTDGNPNLGVPATIVPAVWLNTLQRELLAIIDAASLEPDPEDDEQVIAAIQTLIAESVGAPQSQIDKIYQAIVGSGDGATHASLAAALADAGVVAGSRILVTESQALAATINITKANLLIEFQPGVTFSKDTANTGISIQADGVRIRGGRFSGFSTGGDKAIEVQAGSDYTFITECRFASCDTEVDDAADTTTLLANIEE